MASGKIKGITIELDGDTTGLSSALKGAEKNMGGLRSELREIDKGLKLDPGNMELLGQKSAVLAEQIKAVSEKLKILKDSQEQVNRQFASGQINGDQYRAFNREIETTAASLKKLEGDFEETNEQVANGGAVFEQTTEEVAQTGEAFAETGDKASTFGDTLKAILTADAIKAGVTGIVNAIGAIGEAAAKAVSALAGLAADGVKALANATIETSKFADEILTLSTQTGLSTDTLQAYSYAAELVDVSTETLTGSMAKNIKSMAQATDTTKGTGAAYDFLGVSVRNADGSLRDGETVYWETIDALGLMADGTERDALAMQLFGKSAQDLNPLIAAGSEGVKAFAQEARDMGAVMSDESLAAFGKLDDNMQRLKATQEGLSHTIGEFLLPELTALSEIGVETLGEFSKAMQDAGGDPEKISEAFGNALEGLSEKLEAVLPSLTEKAGLIISTLITAVTDNLPALIAVGTQILTALSEAIGANMPALTEAAVTLMTTLAQAIVQNLPALATAGMEILTGIGTVIMENIDTLIDVAFQLLEFLANGIIEALPQLTDAAVTIILRLVDFLLENLPALIDAAVQIILALTDGLIQALPELIPAAVEAVMAIVEGLLNNLDLLIEAAIELILAIAMGLIEALPLLIEKAPEIIQALVEALIENLPLLIDAAIELLLALASAIIENLPLLIESAGKIIEEIVKGIGLAHEKLAEAALGIFNRLKAFILETDWGQVGSDIINALKNAIMSAAAGIGNFVSSLFSTGGAQKQSIPIAFDPLPRNADDFSFAGIETQQTIAPRGGLSRAGAEEGATDTSRDGGRMLTLFAATADFSGIQEANEEAMKAFEETLEAWHKLGIALVESIVNGVLETRIIMLNACIEIGAAAMIGMEQGMRNNASRPIEAAMEIARQVAAIMAAALGIASPSKVTARIGRFAAEGLAMGMIQSAPLVEAAAVKLGLSAVPKTDRHGNMTATQTSSGAVAPKAAGDIYITNNITVQRLNELPYQIDRANQRALRGVRSAPGVA